MADENKLKFDNTDFGDISLFHDTPFPIRRSKLIVTFGDPYVSTVDIKKLMEAGMNVARFLTPTSSYREKKKLIRRVGKATKILAKQNGLLEWPCATCLELKTSAVKTGFIEGGLESIDIKESTEVILGYDTKKYDKCNEHYIFVDNPYLTRDAKVGMEISIEQDHIILNVLEIVENTLKCLVTKGGVLCPIYSVCIKGAVRKRPLITQKDMAMVKLAVEYQVDMLIVNYVRHVETIDKITKYIGQNRRPFIVSGVCTSQGLGNLDDIIAKSDAILISRDHLAYELDKSLFARMPCIQKMIIGKCRQAGKPIILSGGVFRNTLLTGKVDHQDVSDVTSALLDGVSGFMLDPWDNADDVKIVMAHLSELCAQIEPYTCDKMDFDRSIVGISLPANAAVVAAASSVLLANKAECRVIIIPTVSGHTIYHLDYLRPLGLIIAITTCRKTFRLLQTYRSVVPILYRGTPRRTWYRTVQARIEFALSYAVDMAWIKYGDAYVTLEKGSENASFCDTVRIAQIVTASIDDCENPQLDLACI